MGSATREALARAREALHATGSTADLSTAHDLFSASRVLEGSGQLRAVIADPATDAAEKAAVVKRIFGAHISNEALTLLTALASGRWSTQKDLLAGIEEIGVRAIAASAPRDAAIDDELFAFGSVVADDPELELALRSKRADPAAKGVLVERLLAGRASEQTVAIVRQLVTQPRGRSIRESLRDSAAIVADEAGLSLATVTSARPLAQEQVERLRAALSAQYGRELTLNQIIDPSLIGGLRVRVGDDVIDSSVATRINEVRLQLAG